MTEEQLKIFLQMMLDTAELHEKSARLIRHAIALNEAGDPYESMEVLTKCRNYWRKRYNDVVSALQKHFPEWASKHNFKPGNPAPFSQN